MTTANRMRVAAPAAVALAALAVVAAVATAASEVDENTFRKNELQTAVGHGRITIGNCISSLRVKDQAKGCGNSAYRCERK